MINKIFFLLLCRCLLKVTNFCHFKKNKKERNKFLPSLLGPSSKFKQFFVEVTPSHFLAHHSHNGLAGLTCLVTHHQCP